MRTLPYYHLFAGRGTEPAIELAERLEEIAPIPISKVFFTSSGYTKPMSTTVPNSEPSVMATPMAVIRLAVRWVSRPSKSIRSGTFSGMFAV